MECSASAIAEASKTGVGENDTVSDRRIRSLHGVAMPSANYSILWIIFIIYFSHLLVLHLLKLLHTLTTMSSSIHDCAAGEAQREGALRREQRNETLEHDLVEKLEELGGL